MQAGEKLKPTEVELRRMEEVIAEVVREMDYLREREQKLRDTNESTNERVKWFAIGTMGMLVGLGVWQVIYLRAYFRYGLNAPFNFDYIPLLTSIRTQIEAPHIEVSFALPRSGNIIVNGKKESATSR